MESKPLVSVLMTAYNRSLYIHEAIESVLKSSYTNWELIITDDQSSDNTLEIAKSYADKDHRIKVYLNEKNLGDYPNRNKAASYATGKYLKYLDADDQIYEFSIEYMVMHMERNPSVALGISQSKPEELKPYPIHLTSKECYKEHFLGHGVLHAGPSGTIIRRDIFEEIGGFQVPRFLGDGDMWLRMAQKYDVLKFQPALVWWRQHEGQEINIGNNEYYLFETYPMEKKYLNHTDCPLDIKTKTIALEKLKRNEARKLLSILKQSKNISLFRRLVKHHKFGMGEIFSGLKPYQFYYD